ncbi:MAG: hypothetical protein RL742_648, partial [Bacteroidota bacterium]
MENNGSENKTNGASKCPFTNGMLKQ